MGGFLPLADHQRYVPAVLERIGNRAGQAGAEAGGGLQQMLEALVERGVEIRLCRTCALARGIAEAPLIAGVEIGTLPELAQWTIDADKVITF